MENNVITPAANQIEVTVLTSNKELLNTQLRALMKACKKFKVAEPEVMRSAPYWKTITTIEEGEYDEYRQCYGPSTTYEEQVEVIDVVVSISAMFKLNGDYTLEAIIDNEADIAHQINIDNEVPAEFLATSTKCDHCNKNRARSKSFILQNEEGFIRVGSSCLKAFLGLNPNSYLSALSYLNDFSKELESNSYEKKDRKPNPMNRVVNRDLAAAALFNQIEADGGEYTKAEYDNEGYYSVKINKGKTTGDKVAAFLISGAEITPNAKVEAFFAYVDALEVRYQIDEEFAHMAKPNVYTVYEAGKGMTPLRSDAFKASAKTLSNRKNVRMMEVYLMGGAISGYLKHLIREEEKAAKKAANGNFGVDSTWIGQVGEKSKFKVTVHSMAMGDSQYGTWYRWTFVDAAGNVYTKFGEVAKFITKENKEGEELGKGVCVGDEFAFTADVKDHTEYNGIKQTLLGRFSKF